MCIETDYEPGIDQIFEFYPKKFNKSIVRFSFAVFTVIDHAKFVFQKDRL